MSSERWQKPHVQKVLDYHNKSHHTDFRVKYLSEEFFNDLEHTERWDWVCEDQKAGSLGAVEVKRLTEEAQHEEHSLLEALRTQLQEVVSGTFRGTYILLLHTADQPLNLRGRNIRRFKEALQIVIQATVPNIRLGQSMNLSSELREGLPDVVAPDFHAELRKVATAGSRLAVEIFLGGSAPSGKLHGDDFPKFRSQVQKANRQLSHARTRGLQETFLILLDLLCFLAADTEAVKHAVGQLAPEEYCNIKYIYHLGSFVTPIYP